MYAPVRCPRQGCAFSVLVPLTAVRTATDPSLCPAAVFIAITLTILSWKWWENLRVFFTVSNTAKPALHRRWKDARAFHPEECQPSSRSNGDIRKLFYNKSLCDNTSTIKTVRHLDAESTCSTGPGRQLESTGEPVYSKDWPPSPPWRYLGTHTHTWNRVNHCTDRHRSSYVLEAAPWDLNKEANTKSLWDTKGVSMGYAFASSPCKPALESAQDEGQPEASLSLGSVSMGDPVQLRYWAESEYNLGTSV